MWETARRRAQPRVRGGPGVPAGPFGGGVGADGGAGGRRARRGALGRLTSTGYEVWGVRAAVGDGVGASPHAQMPSIPQLIHRLFPLSSAMPPAPGWRHGCPATGCPHRSVGVAVGVTAGGVSDVAAEGGGCVAAAGVGGTDCAAGRGRGVDSW
ncbi:hypothetical protein ND747_10715 [Frankia sp. R82]|nr:hypothetical protein [Frankia sp. R82]MCM3884125.1 hypothetical protein [Frankia sp. R82]